MKEYACGISSSHDHLNKRHHNRKRFVSESAEEVQLLKIWTVFKKNILKKEIGKNYLIKCNNLTSKAVEQWIPTELNIKILAIQTLFAFLKRTEMSGTIYQLAPDSFVGPTSLTAEFTSCNSALRICKSNEEKRWLIQHVYFEELLSLYCEALMVSRKMFSVEKFYLSWPLVGRFMPIIYVQRQPNGCLKLVIYQNDKALNSKIPSSPYEYSQYP